MLSLSQTKHRSLLNPSFSTSSQVRSAYEPPFEQICQLKQLTNPSLVSKAKLLSETWSVILCDVKFFWTAEC